MPKKTKKSSSNPLDFAGPVEALLAKVDVYAVAKDTFDSAAYAVAIAQAFLEAYEQQTQSVMDTVFFDATKYARMKYRNEAPTDITGQYDIYDSLEHFMETCPLIVWANLSATTFDAAREIDNIMHRRFSAGFYDVLSGWSEPQVMADKDVHASSLSNPYSLLHERVADASKVFKSILMERA